MRHDIFSFTSMLYFPILPGKHSYKKGNIQIFKALVSICCDWLSKTHTAFPPSKYTCHFLGTHAISLMSTRSYHLLFVLQREAKGLFNTSMDWRFTNTQLETLLTWKSLLPKCTKQTAWQGKQVCRYRRSKLCKITNRA